VFKTVFKFKIDKPGVTNATSTENTHCKLTDYMSLEQNGTNA